MPLSKPKLISIFCLAVVSVVAMVTATYAWLSISRIPTVSDISLTIITENAVLIAQDDDGVPGEWVGSLDLSALLDDEDPLQPVTYSTDDNQFYKIDYGDDGRPAGLSDDSADGYYIEVSYWMQCSTLSATVSLAEPTDDVNATKGTGTYLVGEPIWNSSTLSHDNGGNGGETTIRIGFDIQMTDLDGNFVGDSTFFIYEPNADVHVDGSTGVLSTASTDGYDTLVSTQNLIIQNSSYWTEQSPVLMDNVDYYMGDFVQNTDLFTIDSSSLVYVTMYIWMEGQDVDCSNMAIAEMNSLVANIQFNAENVSADSGITAR